jgi:hypothetical protein
MMKRCEAKVRYSNSPYTYMNAQIYHWVNLNLNVAIFYFCFVFGATAPQWARASSFKRILDHTQRRTTVGRTPLDE